MDAEVMLRQSSMLGGDVRQLAAMLDGEVGALLADPRVRSASKVRVVGCGDSVNAAIAAGMAFRAAPGVDYAAVPAFEYAAYADAEAPARNELVLAVSASGGTPSAIEALETARGRGAATVAVVGKKGSALAETADHAVVAHLPDGEPSPGIRTFTASLLTLLIFARRLAEARSIGQHAGPARARGDLQRELDEVAAALDATNARFSTHAAAALDRIDDAAAVIVTGSGPSLGTARHAAAKLVEGAGVLAAAQDVEEWRHVERFAAPVDLPLIVIAPHGRSADRAVRIADFAAALGRRVIAVAPEDSALAAAGHTLLPVIGGVNEELSPLVYQIFAPHLAYHWARRLGRAPFHQGESGYSLPQ